MMHTQWPPVTRAGKEDSEEGVGRDTILIQYIFAILPIKGINDA